MGTNTLTMEPNGSIGATAPTIPKISLNYVTGVASQGEGFKGCGAKSPLKPVGPCCVWPPVAQDDTTTAGELRDKLDTFLDHADTPGIWRKGYWAFNALFRDSMVEVAAIQDCTVTGIQHRRNFLRCETPITRGVVSLDAAGAPLHGKRYRCWDPACPTCHDYDRKRQAAEKVGVIGHVLKTFPGCEKVWRIQFTLPGTLEARPFDDPGYQKRLLGGAHDVIRRAFGVSARSNMPILYEVHPVGDNDLLGRDRWHLHVTIIPCEIVTDRKTKERRFEWRNLDSIDLPKLRDGWAAITGDPATINPEVAYITPGNFDGDWAADPRAWQGKLVHGVSYDMRGFGKDLDQAVLRTNKALEQVAAKLTFHQGGQSFTTWQLVPMADVARRWLWLKKHNKVGVWGFLKCLHHYEDLLKIEEPDEPKEPEHMVDAEVHLIREAAYSKESRRVEVIRDELWIWVCPVTGKARKVLLSDMRAAGDPAKDFNGGTFKELADRQARRRKRKKWGRAARNIATIKGLTHG